MRESKNLDASTVPKKYPNIAKIFDKEWFESEFKKEKEEMHLLARQFTYDEEDRISLHLIPLEDYLATMQEEIAQKKNIFTGVYGIRINTRELVQKLKLALYLKIWDFRSNLSQKFLGRDREVMQ